MGGSTKQITNATSRTTPYGPAQPGIENILGQLTGMTGNTGLTGTETGALNALSANAQAGNQFAPAIGDLATNLLAGGGPDRTGMVGANYDAYKAALTPYATANTDPYSNEAYTRFADMLQGKITDQIRSQYAGAGYSPVGTGDYSKSLGEGIASGLAPTWLQAYQQNEARKLGAIGDIYTGGQTTAGILSGLDQTRLANRQAGIDVAQSALMARDAPYQRQLEIEAQRRGIPVQNLAQLEGLMLAPAQAFGTTTSQQTSEQKVPVAQQIIGGLIGGAGLLAGTGAFGPAGWLFKAGGQGLLNNLGKTA